MVTPLVEINSNKVNRRGSYDRAHSEVLSKSSVVLQGTTLRVCVYLPEQGLTRTKQTLPSLLSKVALEVPFCSPSKNNPHIKVWLICAWSKAAGILKAHLFVWSVTISRLPRICLEGAWDLPRSPQRAPKGKG